MSKTSIRTARKYSTDEILAMENLFHLTDLPEENRTGVMKIINPINWFVIQFNLSEYEGKTVTVKFSADVKRSGAAGTLRWQINNRNYPTVGKPVSTANKDVWHTMKGEWTGHLSASPPVLYLSTWRNDSERTTFYIDNVTLEVVLV